MKKVIALALFTSMATGCSVLKVPNNLPKAMMEQDDPEIVRAGAPAFLLILDALIKGDENDVDYLLPAAQLYGAYAGAFTEDSPKRAKKLSAKALRYARRATCESLDDLCEVLNKPFDEFKAVVDRIDDKDDLPVVFGLASAWAGSIQANTDDWGAIAQLPKVKALVKKVLLLDENYDNGTAQIYMGVLETQLPPSLGGKPEQGRMHFERAIKQSQGKNLMAKVMYAKQYARLLFEQELHDRLLNEVVNADAHAEGLTLINSLAQEQAADLLASSAEYFE